MDTGLEHTDYRANVDLDQKMHNGATLADWLGTARTNSAVVTLRLDRVAEGERPSSTAWDLQQAERGLKLVLEEVHMIMAQLGVAAAS